MTMSNDLNLHNIKYWFLSFIILYCFQVTISLPIFKHIYRDKKNIPLFCHLYLVIALDHMFFSLRNYIQWRHYCSWIEFFCIKPIIMNKHHLIMMKINDSATRYLRYGGGTLHSIMHNHGFRRGKKYM